MNLKNDIRPISYVKSNAAEMLRQVNETRNPIVITQNGEAKAVLLEIEDGKVLENDEVFRDLRNSIDGR